MPMIRALSLGALLGLALFVVGLWGFARGCPVFDVEHDTVLGF